MSPAGALRLAAPPFQQGWQTAGGVIPLDDPVVMGILNLTPDSFSDGGELAGVDDALRRGDRMLGAGAGILDVGGESTRPGASEVPIDEEIRRVVPVIEALVRELGAVVSIDTRKSAVAKAALEAGAVIVNDVSGGAFDPAIRGVVARAGAGYVIMHMRGTPETMRAHAGYGDIGSEVRDELLEAAERAIEAGVRREAIVLDPGIGFAKDARGSLTLLARLELLALEGFPLLVGLSRKSFLGEVLGVPAGERVTGSAVAAALARERGAHLFRVHDVEPTVQALAVVEALARAGEA